MDTATFDQLMEMEHQQNKKESWNKLNFFTKRQKLQQFALTFSKNSDELILVLDSALERGHLNKAKDVIYNRCTEQVTDIPALLVSDSGQYLLKNDRISTLQSLPTKTRQTQK